MVGAARFELATTCTRCRYATRLRYAPTREKYIRAGETIRPVSAQQFDDIFQFLLECGDVDAACLRCTRGRARGRRGTRRCGAQAFVEAIARSADGEALLVEKLADTADQQKLLSPVVATVAAALYRPQLSELLLPIAKDLRLDAAQLAVLAPRRVAP